MVNDYYFDFSNCHNYLVLSCLTLNKNVTRFGANIVFIDDKDGETNFGLLQK